jgi:predicted nucleic-acid-binding protein
MAALDTNVLVRFLVQDDPAQSALAHDLIHDALQAGETLYLPVTVVLELEWVLRAAYRFSKEQVTAALSRLLAATELSFGSESAVEVALALYQKSSADFADCLHIALAHAAGESPLWTLDRGASKVDGARLLTA